MNKRLIILNTVVSYLRSLLTVGLTLFSTRWILEALGKEDLGLYYVVGGVVIFLSFVNTSMAFSSQRHFSFALGHGGTNEVLSWFNSSFSLHMMFAGVFLILSIPLGLVVFRYLLRIPDARIATCYFVYSCSILTAAASIVSVPFYSIYIARQRIYELTILQFVQTLSLFAFSWWLLGCSGDKLLIYAIGMCCITVFVYGVQIVRCRFVFNECRIQMDKMFSSYRYKELLSFSGWSLTSTFAYILRGQGITMILNNFGTSGVNAAYAIANQVSGQAGFLASGLMNAVAPEMTRMEGGGQHEQMIGLATKTCKFITLLVLFILVPLWTDVESLLLIWLKEVPENTNSFVRVMLIAFLAVQMVLGVTVSIKAVGKIAKPEMYASFALLLAIPIAYISVVLGLSMTFVVSSVAFTAILCALSTLLCAKIFFNYPLSDWVREVFIRNSIVIAVCLTINYIIHLYMIPSFERFCIIALVDGVLILLLGLSVVLSTEERMFIMNKFNSVIKKCYGRI